MPNQKTDQQQDTDAYIKWIQRDNTYTVPMIWSFIFFDMPSSEFTRRIRLHRNLRRTGCTMHSQSVYCMPYSQRTHLILKTLDENITAVQVIADEEQAYSLAETYADFIDDLFLELENKVEELEDAKALSETNNSRGYTKRFKKMHEGVERVKDVLRLFPSQEAHIRLSGLETLIDQIHGREQGTA